MTIDDLRPEPNKLSMLCHADSLGILPVQWCLKNGVNLTPPKGLYPVEMCGVGMIQASVSLSPNWCHRVYVEKMQCEPTVMEAKRASLVWLTLLSPIAPPLEKYGVGFSPQWQGTSSASRTIADALWCCVVSHASNSGTQRLVPRHESVWEVVLYERRNASSAFLST